MSKVSGKQYSVLIISAAEQFNIVVKKSLPGGRFSVIDSCKSASAAKRKLLVRSYDMIIINSPLLDEFGTQSVMDIHEKKSMGIVIVVPNEVYSEVSDRLIDYGVITVAKPIKDKQLSMGIRLLLAMQENMMNAQRKVVKLEEKMEELRLISRAKIVLVQRGMTEEDAHEYIIRQAMNSGMTKKAVAEEILF